MRKSLGISNSNSNRAYSNHLEICKRTQVIIQLDFTLWNAKVTEKCQPFKKLWIADASLTDDQNSFSEKNVSLFLLGVVFLLIRGHSGNCVLVDVPKAVQVVIEAFLFDVSKSFVF